MPLVLDPHSEPEPDLAVVAGEPADYRMQHPQTALLIVEIADTSILRDREIKGRIYAKGGIAEYCIVNLTNQTLEVYRDPLDERFRTFQTLTATQHITPLSQPSLSIHVADLLP